MCEDTGWVCELLGVRFDADTIKAVDDWRRRTADIPNRSEAVRRLVALGLKVKRKA